MSVLNDAVHNAMNTQCRFTLICICMGCWNIKTMSLRRSLVYTIILLLLKLKPSQHDRDCTRNFDARSWRMDVCHFGQPAASQGPFLRWRIRHRGSGPNSQRLCRWKEKASFRFWEAWYMFSHVEVGAWMDRLDGGKLAQ